MIFSFLQNPLLLCALCLQKVNVREGTSVHFDICELIGQLFVNIGYEDYAKKEISVNFFMNLIWLKCLNAIFMQDLVSFMLKMVFFVFSIK